MPGEQQGSQIVIGFKRETAYGTEIQLVADDGAHFTAHDVRDDPQWVENNMINGASVVQQAPRLGQELYRLTYTAEVRYAGAVPLLMGVLAGSDAYTQIAAGVGGTHEQVPQPNNDNESLTFARWMKDMSEVEVLTGVKPVSAQLSVDAGGPLMITVEAVAQNLLDSDNDTPTNTTSTMASVTTPIPEDALMYNDMTVQLGDQTGAAFAGGGKVTVQQLQWQYQRQYKLVQAENSLLIQQPSANGWMQKTLSARFPTWNNLNRETDLRTVTRKRMLVTFIGPDLTGGTPGVQVHAARFYFPQLHTRGVPREISGPQGVELAAEYSSHEAATAPNDMDSKRIAFWEFDNERETSYLS